MARLYDQFAVVETNHVAAVRTGQIKAQYPTDDHVDAENGMLLVVDDVNKVVHRSADGKERGIHLHASEERLYEGQQGRSSWMLDGTKQIPKMLKLNIGDIFETNAVDDGDFANIAAVKDALNADDAVYGIAHDSGLIELKDDALDLSEYFTVLQVVEVVTLPNETEGMKFTVIKA